MASITSWVRLEPRARDADLMPGVEARLHDPLWLLARQWQLGELTGADAGSAIIARARADQWSVDGVRSGDAPWTALDPTTTPLAATALAPSRDDPAAHPPIGRRARGGRHLLRLLAAAGHADDGALFLSRFALVADGTTSAALDDADRRLLAVVGGLVPDADLVATALEPLLPDDTARLPPDFGIPIDHVDDVSAVCRRWLKWYGALVSVSHAPSWRPDQLAYDVDVRARSSNGALVLSARRDRDAEVRWFDFDAAAGTPNETGSGSSAPAIVTTCLPTRARFRGMPARRYWELEDAAVHWPSIDAGPGDIGRVLFVEFGLTFADHWLTIPLEVPAGSVTRVASLVVTDTFGTRTLIVSASSLDARHHSNAWRFTQLQRADAPLEQLVFIPPAATELVGPTLDAIDFARDDVGDVVWAIDRTILGGDGRPRDVATVPVTPPPPRAPGAPELAYRLGPSIAAAYHAYRHRGGDAAPRVELAAIPGSPSAGARPELPAQLSLAALPARPTRLACLPIALRSPDGSYHVVKVRATSPVSAPPNPGLVFDSLEVGR